MYLSILERTVYTVIITAYSTIFVSISFLEVFKEKNLTIKVRTRN